MRDLLDRLDGWRDEQIEFLARLVNHDSGTDDVLDVNRVGAILVERLERLGFTVRRVVNDRFGDHLVGDKPGTGPKRFLFVGHYDTVFPSGTAKQRPFRIDDQGRAWGPGVYDMKGGLTALLYALRAHQEARTRTWAETNVSVVFNADEERLSPTSREVIGAEARRAHSVGILEPARPGGEYVMARKGAGTFYLEVDGQGRRTPGSSPSWAPAPSGTSPRRSPRCTRSPISRRAPPSTSAPCAAASAPTWSPTARSPRSTCAPGAGRTPRRRSPRCEDLRASRTSPARPPASRVR